MPYEFKVTRRVEFSETDMAGIMHYSNYFRFMETAEHAFYRALGFSVVSQNIDPPIGFPRVHAECDFKKPLRFEDLVEIHLLVREKKSKSITYSFRFGKVSAAAVENVAQGIVTVVCVTRNSNGDMSAVPIPAAIADKIEVAPQEIVG